MELDLLLFLLLVPIDPDDHAFARLHLSLVPEGRLLDLALDEALLDRSDCATATNSSTVMVASLALISTTASGQRDTTSASAVTPSPRYRDPSCAGCPATVSARLSPPSKGIGARVTMRAKPCG